jgi:hypothetical protein
MAALQQVSYRRGDRLAVTNSDHDLRGLALHDLVENERREIVERCGRSTATQNAQNQRRRT